MKETTHIQIGENLILRIKDIISVNLTAKDNKDEPCIKIQMEHGTTWTVWGDLKSIKTQLKKSELLGRQTKVLNQIESVIYKVRMGRESNVSKEIKGVLTNLNN